MKPRSRTDAIHEGPAHHRREIAPKNLLTPKVLVVEDDADVRKMLEVALATFQIEAYTAASSNEAQDLARREKFDVVLIDLHVPLQDGADTWAALKAIDPTIRCCFMSASAGACTVDDLMRHGADGFLAKPFHLADLRNMILDSAGKRNLAQTG